VIAAGRGAGADLELYRRLADVHGARFAVTRPQVEAGRAVRAELVGASSETVAPAVYVAFGASGAFAHVVGLAGSGRVLAVNSDPQAAIFGHADLGAVADAGAVAAALLDLSA
jgi:electron transfer flavoprotein alpha subunit